jgi:hypothetical protein
MDGLHAGSAAEQTSAQSLHDDVLQWVQREGYPLEMTVANAFYGSGPVFVEQSKYYQDVTTGDVREADVVAIYSGILPGEEGKAWLTAYVVAECKGGSSPWITFRQHESKDEYDKDIALRMLPAVGIDHERFGRIMRHAVNADPKLLTARWRPGYAITEKRTSGKGGIDKAYEAVRQAASAVAGILAETSTHQSDNPALAAVAIPVVVTRGPLFNCQLDENGELSLEQVERSAVVVRASARSEPVVVHVTTLGALSDFVDDCGVTVGGLCVSTVPPSAA